MLFRVAMELTARKQFHELIANIDCRGRPRALAGGAGVGAINQNFATRKPHNFRSFTVCTEWSFPFFRMRWARSRVGRMFSLRFTALISRQICPATFVASSADRPA